VSGIARDSTAVRTAGPSQGVLIILAGFLPILAIVALAPVVPKMIEHFASVPGATTLIPLAVTAPGLMIALLAPAMGWLADRHGRRRLLLIATLFYGFVGIAPFFLDNLIGIFAARLGLGVCEAAIMTVANALVGDYFGERQRRFWLMLQSALGPILGVSVLIGAGHLATLDWRMPFLIYAISFPIFLAMLVFIFEPQQAVARDMGEIADTFPTRHMIITCAVTLFCSSLYYVYIVQVGLAYTAIGVTSPDQIGSKIGLANIGIFFGGLLFRPLSEKLGSAAQVAIFLVLMAIGMIGIGLAKTGDAMMMLSIVQQLGAGMMIPVLLLWVISGLPLSHRGRGMGIWSSCFFIGQFTSPLLVTASGAAVGSILNVFALLGAIALIGAALARLFVNRLQQKN